MKVFPILAVISLVTLAFAETDSQAANHRFYKFYCDGEKIHENGRSVKLSGQFDPNMKVVLVGPTDYIKLSLKCSGNLEASRTNSLFSFFSYKVPVAPQKGVALKEFDDWTELYTAQSSSIDELERELTPILDSLDSCHHFANEGILRSVTVSPATLIALMDPVVYEQTKGKNELTKYLRNKGMLYAPVAIYLGLNDKVSYKDLSTQADNWIDDRIAEAWSFADIGKFLVRNILPHAGYLNQEIEDLISQRK